MESKRVAIDGQNGRKQYTVDPNDPNVFTNSTEPGSFLRDNGNETFTFVGKHGAELDFDSNGNLSAISDRYGSSISFTYDSNGLMPVYGPSEFFLDPNSGGPANGRGLVAMSYKLTKITDDLGHEINLTYDSNGLLSTVTDFTGRAWVYDYNSVTNDLVSVTGPNTPQYPSGLKTTYTYDTSHNLLTISDPNGQTWLTNVYDANDRVDEQTYGNGTYEFSYNPDSNEVTVTSRTDVNTVSVYSSTGNLVSDTIYTKGLRQSDPCSYSAGYTYDPNHKLKRKTFPAGNCVDYTYDDLGNVTGIYIKTAPSEPNDANDPDVIASIFTYEPAFNFVKTARGPKGNVTTYTYDYEDKNLLVINEFMASNNSDSGIQDEYGDYDDWFEIYNAGSVAIDIGGMYLSDNLSTPTEYQIPTDSPGDTTIDAHGYLLIWADDETGQGPLHANFKLGASGDEITLVDTDGSTLIDSVEFGAQTANISCGRSIDARNNWQFFTTPSPEEENAGTPLVINEFMASNSKTLEDPCEAGEFPDWLEIHNAGSTSIDLGGMYLTDNFNTPTKWQIPAGLSIGAGGYLIFWADDDDEQGDTHTNFKLGAAGEEIGLFDTDGSTMIDSITFGPQSADVSYGCSPDASNKWHFFDIPTPENENSRTDIGNLIKITYPTVSTPSGNQTPTVTFKYNSYGQVIETTSPDGIITRFEYYSDANDTNNFGRLSGTIADYGDANDSNYLNITTTYEYDNLGRAIEVNDPNDDKTTFAYNSLNQLTEVTASSPYSYVTKFSYNKNKKLSQIENVRSGDANQITSYTYDILDNLKTIKGPLNYVTTNSYDNSERLTDVNDAEENNTHCDYDERGLLWRVTDADGNFTEYSYTTNGSLADINDPNSDKTTYSYDSFDRLKVVTYPYDTNEVFDYDKNSNLISFANRKGETIYYEYDVLNRMTVKDRPGEPDIVYRYDIAGRIYDVNDGRGVSIGGGITGYSYDRIGRVTEVNDIESRLVKYEYDDRGLQTKLTYPDGSFITYEYDTLGRLKRIKDSNSPTPNVLAQYSYDDLSRRTLVTLGNDANAVYEYDLGNQLTKLTNNIDDSNSITFEYSSYDKVGNRLSCKIDDANARVYNFDELYQLIFVDYNDGNTISYAYDSLGNRTDVNGNGSVTAYNRNSLNQYTSVGGIDYDYNPNGNLVDINNGEYEYIYDCENHLIEAKQDSQTIATYAYDYVGRRISKTVSGTTTKYCYDGAQVIAEYENNTLVRKFVYGPGIDEPVCMIDVSDGNSVYYYHFDGLGSVIALSDFNSEIVERYSYDVFGEPNRTSDVNNPYLFTGRRYDDESGLYYYRARYYSPEIGRFLQTDPIGYTDGLNVYTYCGNDPVNWKDVYGLCKDMSDEDIRNYAESLREMVQRGEIDDVEALARIMDLLGNRYSGLNDDEQAFVNHLSRLLTDRAGRWGSRHGQSYVQFGHSGFAERYQGPGNQVRHFVGFVAAGYYWERIGGTLALADNERWGFEEMADWRLGVAGIDLGISISWGPLGTDLEDVGDWIREELRD